MNICYDYFDMCGLKDFSLMVNLGDFICLMGFNGFGKLIFLWLLSGLVSLISGVY